MKISPQPQIPGYSIGKRLDWGERTLAYRAVEALMQRTVIIEFLAPEQLNGEELMQFRHRYTIAKQLDLPGVIRPERLLTWGNSYAIVMADWEGISLAGDRQQRSLTLDTILKIALQLAEILHALQQAGVIHKNINPTNILIDPESAQIRLSGFSIATLLPKESPTLKHPHRIEGNLAYISPEQTGRMNRGIDYRTDFYSVGVTLYELLTTELPFQLSHDRDATIRTEDLLELVHCHIAQTPVPVCDRQPEIPQMVSRIVAKLMAKNVEDRYQSAIGLQHDFQICWEQWQTKRSIDRFELGTRDLSDRFTIPERLYGRERAIETLLAAFERVSNGASELLLVAGSSGIGKTIVVNEIHQPITRQHGYFIKGKFDRFDRHLPLSAVVSALRDLVGQLLGESDAELACWKVALLQVLGDNASVIIDVIPELAQIIGTQPPAAELSGTAAHHRFNLLFQNFIRVFATAAHPLVIFLDDLQWIDPASLGLIQLLIAAVPTSHLLIIGTYRDNEVAPADPLRLTLAEIAKSSAIVTTIGLEPLSVNDLDRLVADTLSCSASAARPLAELIYAKTQGNPFFATQLLVALHREGWITLDRQTGHWQCDLAQIRTAILTDDVVEFLVGQLQKLPPATQAILKLAACLGDRFDLATLAIVSAQPPERIAVALGSVLQAGQIVPQDRVYAFWSHEQDADVLDLDRATVACTRNTYRFLHDRVRQAAYSLIPVECKQLEHLRIGRLLLAQLGNDDRPAKLFELVRHLNVGRSVVEGAELVTFARLNLVAAHKARSATAYRSALDYAQVGIELLATIGWQQQYELCLTLHHVAAETAFLAGEFDRATALVEIAIGAAKTAIDCVPAYETQIQLYTSQKNYRQAIEWGLCILAELGVKIPANPSKLQLSIGFIETKLLLHGKSNETLLQLPLMTDPQQIAAMRILNLISYPAYFHSQPLLGALTFVGVKLLLRSGNSIWSASAYSQYSTIVANVSDFAASYRMSRLALQSSDRFPNPAIAAQVKLVAAFGGLPCQQPARDSLPLLRSAIQSAVANGDLIYAGIAYYGDCALRMVLGEPLDELLTLADSYRQAVVAMKDRSNLFLLEIIYQLFSKLQQPDLDPYHLFESETADLQHIEELTANHETSALAIFYAYQAYLCYVFEDVTAALKYAALYSGYERENSAMYASVQMTYIEGLIRLAAYPTSSPLCQHQILDRVTKIQKLLARRARFAPANFQSRQDLLAAERCRVGGKNHQAIELYDRAIAVAIADNDLQQAALSNELAAKFYLGWGKTKVAAGYMQEAYDYYLLWGAKAKTADLARRYPQLLAPIRRLPSSEVDLPANLAVVIDSGDRTQQPHDFDLASVLQSIRVLSSTLDLEDLLQKSIQIILINAGAQTCILALPDSTDVWQISAIATVNPDRLPVPQLPQPLVDTGDYPVSTIYWVKNTNQPLAIDARQPLEIPDRYLLNYQPQSVFCLPIGHQEQLFGVLYLEHRQAPNLFRADKQIVISLLCAQLAIAIANARLYHQAQLTTAKLQREQKYLETLLDNIPHMAWLKDEHHRYIAANRVLAEVVGSEPADLIGKNDFDFWPIELAQADRADDLSIMTSGERKVAEEKITLPNGEYRWLETIKTPIKNSAGQLTGTVGIAQDITERRMMESALRESQRQHQQLADNIPGTIYQLRMTPDGTVTYPYISSGCQQLLEVSPAAVMNDPRCLLDLIHPDDRAISRQLLMASARELQPKACEGRAVLASGEVKWIKSVSRPELQPDGSIVWDGVMLDITDRQVVEQALQASQRQYQRLADNIPGAILQFQRTLDGRISVLYVSSGCQDVFGLSPAAVIADVNCAIALAHPDDFQLFQTIVAASARDLTAFAWEGRIGLPDGTTKWIELTSRPELQPDGAIVWDGVLLDITERQAALCERKQAELNLAASQAKYYSLIQAIPGVVWEFDLQLKQLSFVSDRAVDLLGYPLETWFTEDHFWANRLHPEDRDAAIALFDRAVATGQPCEHQYRMITADRQIRWVYDTFMPVVDLDGNTTATKGLLIDITDRQQTDIALQQTYERLESTNQELLRATKLKDEFLATMSHELRTPLNAILGMSECLTEGVFGSINERQAKSIETIHRSGQHLLALINDILDVSKIAAGKLELDLTTVPLQRLCDASLAFVRSQADRKQIRLDTDIPTQLGTICIDERRMRQVLINLLSNAVKFTPTGGCITLAVENVTAPDRSHSAGNSDGLAPADWLRISVTDTGIGISLADRDRLFQPFIQIDSSLNRQYEGTGLGLTIVKQLVELHGGYVTLTSELGQGSCFSISLPHNPDRLHRSPIIDASDRFSCAPNDERQAIAIQPTILLAEDDPTNLITFVSYLNVKGYRTIAAKDGAEAIALATTHQPDLILMDIQMPGMDGIEAILQIRQDPHLAKIPIVALTALAQASDRQKCLNAGANEYLVKPVKLKELNRTIEQCLDLN